MVSLKIIGDWLENSGWVEALVQAGVTSTGTADPFLSASHVTRTRYAHQVTAAALYMLQKRAYSTYQSEASFDDNVQSFDEWVDDRRNKYPQFRFWHTAMC